MSEKIKKYKAYIIEALFFAALLAVDLISKPLAFAFLKEKGGSYVVFEGIYELVEVHNDGASFGIFGGKTSALIAVTAISMIILAALLVWRPRAPKLFRYGIIAIVAGGVGNLVDRLVYGYVRDFIDYKFLETFFGIDNFGVGNIADIFVLVGLLCIVVYVFFGYKEGDFAKNPHPSDDLPEVLVVNEGEQEKKSKTAEKEGLIGSVGENKTSEAVDSCREVSGEKPVSGLSDTGTKAKKSSVDISVKKGSVSGDKAE